MNTIEFSLPLSKCTDKGTLFLYGTQLVSLPYILRMIWQEKPLPKIRVINAAATTDKGLSLISNAIFTLRQQNGNPLLRPETNLISAIQTPNEKGFVDIEKNIEKLVQEILPDACPSNGTVQDNSTTHANMYEKSLLKALLFAVEKREILIGKACITLKDLFSFCLVNDLLDLTSLFGSFKNGSLEKEQFSKFCSCGFVLRKKSYDFLINDLDKKLQGFSVAGTADGELLERRDNETQKEDPYQTLIHMTTPVRVDIQKEDLIDLKDGFSFAFSKGTL